MQKLYTLLAVILMSIFTLAGCGSANNQQSAGTTETNKESSNSNVYKDGTYKGTYDKPDKHGWKSQLNIVVEGGKITKVDFNSVDTKGKLKTEDDNYEKSMKEKSPLGPKEYTPKLDQQLLDSQTASKIDGVTGATQSSSEFKDLSKAVLDKAKTGDTSQTVLPQKAS